MTKSTMQVTFLGVGEACDPEHGNTSLLVHTGGGHFLLDCGFSVPHALFARMADAIDLRAVWLSHFHGDHFFGLPLLLLRMWEAGRLEDLHIVGPQGVEEIVPQVMNLAYPGFWDLLTFAVHVHTLHPGQNRVLGKVSLRAAWTDHSQPNLGLRLDAAGKSLYYSGDGRPGPRTLELARGCDLMVHEGFHCEQIHHGHGTVREVMQLARDSGVQSVAVVHMHRQERKDTVDQVRQMLQNMSSVRGILPEDGEVLQLE